MEQLPPVHLPVSLIWALLSAPLYVRDRYSTETASTSAGEYVTEACREAPGASTPSVTSQLNSDPNTGATPGSRDREKDTCTWEGGAIQWCELCH